MGAEEEKFEVTTVVDGTELQDPYNDVAMLPDGSVLLSDKIGHCIWKFTEGNNRRKQRDLLLGFLFSRFA